MLSIIYPRKPFFCNAGLPVQSFASLIPTECSRLFKNTCLFLATCFLKNRFLKIVYRRSICWQMMQDVSSFCRNSSKSPISITWHLQRGKKHILLSCWALHYFYSHCIFHMCLQRLKNCLLNNFHENWDLVVALQLPSDRSDVFWTSESKQQSNTIFEQVCEKKKQPPYMKISRFSDQKWKISLCGNKAQL